MTLAIERLSKRYGDERAVDDVSLAVDSDELVGLLGPSGCGKTTLVQAIAGHVTPTAGSVRLRGEDVTDRPPERRRVGIVFQQSTLFPHMTVAENVGYGLEPSDLSAGQRAARVDEYLDLVGLDSRHGAYPDELSGGQKRRVELARALAPQPDILLLDEPLAALDRKLRTRLRDEIGRIQRETGVTTVFVTHDQEEAMALADRLVVMHDGQVAGIGQPRELYEAPPSAFVSEFLGRTNSLDGSVDGTDPATLSVAGESVPVQRPDGTAPGTEVTVHARPRSFSLNRTHAESGPPEEPGTSAELSIRVSVRRVIDRGTRYDLVCHTGSNETLVVQCRSDPPSVGDSRTISIPVEDLLVFDGVAGERVSVEPIEQKSEFVAQSDVVGEKPDDDSRSSDVR